MSNIGEEGQRSRWACAARNPKGARGLRPLAVFLVVPDDQASTSSSCLASERRSLARDRARLSPRTASQLDASFVTEVVILLSWALTTWYVYFTFKESGHAKGKTIALTLVVLAGSTFAFGAVKYGFDREFFRGLPVRPPVYLFLAAGLGYAFRWALVGKGLSQHMLVGLQVVRIPIGWVFVLEHWRGNLPGAFAHPAGWGDLLVGIIALAVLIRYRNREIPNGAVILVFTVGITDFVSAFFFGLTSSASPFQLFAFDQPNQVLLYPTGLIPLFLVPHAVIFHILSLTEMQRSA